MLTVEKQGQRAQSLEEHGIERIAGRNLGMATLIEHAIRRGEGSLSSGGALVVRTGQFTGRSPKDKFIVRDETTDAAVDWGAINQPMAEADFRRIHERLAAFWRTHPAYLQDCAVGAAPDYAYPVRVITQYAWHALFARQLFIRPGGTGDSPVRGSAKRAAPTAQAEQDRGFTILFAPEFQADPARENTRSGTCIAVDFQKRIVLICGTSYAGEMKKAAFGIMNYLLPARGVFPMHCSANVGPDGDVALFFGLSGTGKTTLSADPHRRLIGDDEHGWSDDGVFNFEGGCYAKCIRLSHEQEPQIWNAIRFGTVLENVMIDPETRELDFQSGAVTENTRAAYPVEFIDYAVIPGVGGHPRNIIFLAADAFGVLPPIARLTREQAMYHFLSGYTAKVAGTERGLGSAPEATFSTGFAAPFLPRPPREYAALLGHRMDKHAVNCWLVNTGWVGGPYGAGERMKLAFTRAMLNAALAGWLADVPTVPHPVFRIAVPQSCPGVPAAFLDPRGMWSDKQAYDRAARDLAARFQKNFEHFPKAPPEINTAGPAV